MAVAAVFWALTAFGLVGSNGVVHREPQTFPPSGAAAHHRVAFVLGTTAGAGRRARWFAKVVEPGKPDRRVEIPHPSAPPVFDARDRVAYAVGDEIRWLDGRRERVSGLPRGARIEVLEFAPRGGDAAVTVLWGASTHDAGREAIFVVSAHRTRAVAEGFAPAAEVADPVWSPQGTWIAYGRQWSGQDDAVYAVRASGGSEVRVSHVPHAFGPVWSPDGKEIAFTAWRYYTNASVYVATLRGAERRVTPFANGRVAGAFSPDGKLVAVKTGNTLGVVPAAGGTVRILTRVRGVRPRDGLGRGPVLWPRSR